MSATMMGLDCDTSLTTARQAIYRFTALTFLDPRAGSWEQLADPRVQQATLAAADLIRNKLAAVVTDLARGELPLERLDPIGVIDRLPGTREELNAEFESTFGLLVSGNCTPYETEYIGSKFTFQRSQSLAEIAGFYRAFGLEPGHRHRERHDHIVLELEFMAFLIGLELQATQNVGGDEHSMLCRSAQQRFLRDHLAWWSPAFARLLQVTARESFYAEAARFLAAWIPAERALLQVPPQSGPVRPSTIEPPEHCEGCLTADF